MKGKGAERTSANFSGHMGMYGHFHWNGKISCKEKDKNVMKFQLPH